MVLTTMIEGIARIIVGYTGYKRGQAKEDDLAVRKKLNSELDKSRENLRNTLEFVHDEERTKDVKMIKRALDEIDMFSNEIDLSETGHNYPFYDPKKSAKKKDIEKIVTFDKAILDQSTNLTEATKELHKRFLKNENIDVKKESAMIRNYVTQLRNNYKDRMEYIKKR